MNQQFPVHTTRTAPEESRSELERVGQAFGMIPNLAGVLAAAPAALEAYFTLGRIFEGTSFTPAEQQVVLLSVSAENECDYCVAAHTAIAGRQKVPGEVVQAIRNGQPIPDARLEALRQLTASLVTRRGRPRDEDLERFFAAGYSPRQLLEVLVGVGMKTISNYVNHIAETPLDVAFEKAAWAPPCAACAR